MNEQTASDHRNDITGVVLAGGRATRMGGVDKGMIPINGQPMIEYVITALRPQVSALLINANRNQAFYHRFNHPVFGDDLTDYQGPLAGVIGAMDRSTTPLLLTAPCDGPLLPADLAARLATALETDKAEVAIAHDGKRLQSVYALMRADSQASLQTYLDSGERKVDRWYASLHTVAVDFSDRPDLFLNINTPAERDALAQRLRNEQVGHRKAQ